MKENLPFGPMLGRCAHLSRERLEARLVKYDVTPSQTHVLMYLQRNHGQVPQCELTTFLKVKPSTVNGLVDRLCAKGLIERSVSGSDARRKMLTLTEPGKEQLHYFELHFRETEELIVKNFTEEEQQTFRSMLDRIIQNLEEDRKA